MWPWEDLGLPPTLDRVAIRRAYAARLKQTRPEDDPEGFETLRKAYEAATKAIEIVERKARENPAPAPDAPPPEPKPSETKPGQSPERPPEPRPAPPPAPADEHPDPAPEPPRPEPAPSPYKAADEALRQAVLDAFDAEPFDVARIARTIIAARATSALTLSEETKAKNALLTILANDDAVPGPALIEAARLMDWPNALPRSVHAERVHLRLEAHRWLASLRPTSRASRLSPLGPARARRLLRGRGKIRLGWLAIPRLPLMINYAEAQAHGPWLGDALDKDRLASVQTLLFSRPGRAAHLGWLGAVGAALIAIGAFVPYGGFVMFWLSFALYPEPPGKTRRILLLRAIARWTWISVIVVSVALAIALALGWLPRHSAPPPAAPAEQSDERGAT